MDEHGRHDPVEEDAIREASIGETKDGDPVAFYYVAEQARVAVKLLMNQGFGSEQIAVVCTDEKRSEEFRSRMLPTGAEQLDSAPKVVSAAGAAIGAGLLGAAGLASGGLAAAAGAAVGAAGGAGIGYLIGAGTTGTDDQDQIADEYSNQLKEGAIVVLARNFKGDPEKKQLALQLLEEAKAGTVG